MGCRARFGNCDDASTADDPGQRNGSRRAVVRCADLRKSAITHDEMTLATEGRVSHHWHMVLRAPGQKVMLDTTVSETVRDLIGCATMAVWNSEQRFHLRHVERSEEHTSELQSHVNLVC